MGKLFSKKMILVIFLILVFLICAPMDIFGQYTLLADSSVELACFTLDPTTGIIYAQDDGNTGGGTDFFSYDPSTDTWTTLAVCPLDSGNNGGGAYINGKVYTIYTSNSTSIGVYTISSNSWTTITNGLGSGTGCLATDGTYLFAVRNTTFKRFDPGSGSWKNLANSSISFQPWGGLAYYNGWIYGHSGNGGTAFAKYEIASDTWTTLTSVPGGAVLGSDIDPVAKIYYCTGSYGGNSMYKFDMEAETWSTETLPWSPTDDGGMAYSCLSGSHGMYVSQGQAGTAFAHRSTPAGCGCIVANPGGEYTIYEGDSVTLDGSGSTGASSYAWDLNDDGTYGDATGVNPSISWATLNTFGITSVGGYPVGLEIDDGTGCTVYGSTVLNVITTDPTVTTQAVSATTSTTATGNGKITDLGLTNPTAHGVCWNTTGTPTISDFYTDEGGTSSTGDFSSSMSGLSPSTMYYVRAYATNDSGTSYGGEVNFTTDVSPPPTITTLAVTEITPTTSTGNGDITNLGGTDPTAHGVCWNTIGTPIVSDDHTNEGGTSSTGVFSSSMTGLIPTTMYYVRAYAINDGGTSYGSEVSFTTSVSPPPSIDTLVVWGVTATTAIGKGNITDLGGTDPTAHGVCWSTKINPTLLDNHTNLGGKTSTGMFSSPIKDLLPETTYYVRAYAINNSGTSYGESRRFATWKIPGIIITNPVNHSTVSSMVLITASSDVNLIQSEFFIDDLSLGLGFSHFKECSINWDTSGVSEGLHKIKVVALDQYGQSFNHEIEVKVLNLQIVLNGIRKTDNALTFKILYGEISFNVVNPGNIPVAEYVIYKKMSGTDYSSLVEISAAELVNNTYLYRDKVIDSGQSYTYKIAALDSSGTIISVSNEKTI